MFDILLILSVDSIPRTRTNAGQRLVSEVESVGAKLGGAGGSGGSWVVWRKRKQREEGRRGRGGGDGVM